MIFNKKSRFLYKASRADKGDILGPKAFFIRRSNWREVLDLLEEPGQKLLKKGFQQTILSDYVQKIYLPIQQH